MLPFHFIVSWQNTILSCIRADCHSLQIKDIMLERSSKHFICFSMENHLSLINKRNAKETPIEIPTCLKELKMKYHSSWYEEKQDRFRIKFACPITKQDCEHRNTKYGCTKYFQVRKSFPGEVQQHSPTFKDTCPQRQSVERVNAFLQNLG